MRVGCLWHMRESNTKVDMANNNRKKKKNICVRRTFKERLYEICDQYPTLMSCPMLKDCVVLIYTIHEILFQYLSYTCPFIFAFITIQRHL